LGVGMVVFEDVIDATDGKIPIFFLFEENAYWYSIAYEAISRLALVNKVRVVIIGSKIPSPLFRTRGWMNSKGGFFSKNNGMKWVGRAILSKAFHGRRPSVQLISSLKNLQNVEVINISEMMNRQNDVFKSVHTCSDLSLSRIQKMVKFALSEDYATEFPEVYVSKHKFDSLVNSALQVADLCRNVMSSYPLAQVFLINGRTLYERICYELATQNGIPTISFETDSTEEKLTFFQGNVLDYKELSKAVEKFWSLQLNLIGEKKSKSIAEAYFKKRQNEVNSNIFLKNQTNSIVQQKSHSVRNRYVFFTSSNDELKAGLSLDHEDDNSQNNVIKQLVYLFQSNSFYSKDELVIRVHPNLNNKKRADKKFFESLRTRNNVVIYNHKSEINSYALMHSADYIITAGSTLTMEAAYCKKPCVSFFPSIWGQLSISNQINEIDQISDAFSESVKNLEQRHAQALKYALFQSQFGVKFEFIDLKQRLDLKHGVYLDFPLRSFSVLKLWVGQK
jgi:hypothetical protein